MLLLDKIKKTVSGKQWISMVDPVFGELKRRGGQHLAHVLFAPTGQKVMLRIFISHGRARPEPRLTDRHRELFREFERRYLGLAQEVALEVFRRYPHYTEDFAAAKVWQEFALENIEILDREGWPLPPNLSHLQILN